jgi:acyl-CoA synthetase (AMP-forming)/AMP-acid ligase II
LQMPLFFKYLEGLAVTEPFLLNEPWRHLTLPSLLRTCAQARGQRPALADAPDRAKWTSGAPEKLNFAEYGARVARMAAVLKALKLQAGERVLLALPNTVDMPIALLAVLEAGAIPAIMSVALSAPAMAAAAEAVEASMIITCSQLASQKPMECAAVAAAQYLPIRHVCAFGADVTLGIVPLEKAMAFAGNAKAFEDDFAASDAALITFRPTSDGPEPIVHTHAQMIATALAVLARAPLFKAGALISTVLPATAGAVAAAVVAPLLSGAALHLHGPFDADTLVEQVARLDQAPVLLPGLAESIVRGPLLHPAHPVVLTYDVERPVLHARSLPGATALMSVAEIATAVLGADNQDWSLRPHYIMHPMSSALHASQPWLRFDQSNANEINVEGPGVSRIWRKYSAILSSIALWPSLVEAISLEGYTAHSERAA